MVCDGVWSLTWRECFYIKKYIILARPHLCWVYTSRTLNDMALLKNNYIAWEWLIAREVLSSCTSKAYVPTVLSCFLCWIRSLINKLGKNVRLQPWCHLNTFMCTQTPRISVSSSDFPPDMTLHCSGETQAMLAQRLFWLCLGVWVNNTEVSYNYWDYYYSFRKAFCFSSLSCVLLVRPVELAHDTSLLICLCAVVTFLYVKSCTVPLTFTPPGGLSPSIAVNLAHTHELSSPLSDSIVLILFFLAS